MTKFLGILIVGLFLINTTQAYAKKLIIVGDSLTEGYGVAKSAAYPALLEAKLNEGAKEKWEVINSGVSGSTTASAASRIRWVLKAKPDVILLALGANDGLRGINTGGSEKNLTEAIGLAVKANVKVILASMKMPPNYGAKFTADFEAVFANVAKVQKVPLMPFLLDGVAGNPKLNLADGIHPNEEGHKVVAENVFKFLRNQL